MRPPAFPVSENAIGVDSRLHRAGATIVKLHTALIGSARRRRAAPDTFRPDALIATDNLIDTASNRYVVDFISDQHYIVHRSYRVGRAAHSTYWPFVDESL